MKKTVMVRVSPGDRWASVGDPENVLAETLTEALTWIWRTEKTKEFIINAKEGKIFIDDGLEEPKTPVRFSLYDE